MIFFRFFVCMNLRSYRTPSVLLLVAIGSLLPAREATITPSRGEVGTREIRDVVPKGDYLLQPGDIIRVLVLGEEELNKLGEVRVSQEFTVVLPLIGSVDLKGKTVRQGESVIRALYEKDYLVSPQVNVSVLKYVERTVQVFGSVNKPGVVPYPPEEGLSLSEAISRAEGFTRLADKKKVTLTRVLPDGTTDSQVINADDLLKGKSGVKNVPLQPNDTISVAERIL